MSHRSAASRTVLVTCIYNGLAGTRYGGRLNRDAEYAASLTTIAGSGLPVVCFVAPEALDAHRRHFAAVAPNVSLVPLALADVPWSAAAQRIKQARADVFDTLEWRERSLEIMWGKFHMLRRVLDDDPAVSRLYWIDARLAHVDIISTRYITPEALAAGRLCDVPRAFPSLLFDRVADFAGHRLVALRCTVPHNHGIPARYNARPYDDGAALIGGFFGGPRDAVRDLCARFDAKAEAVLAAGELYFEESLLTGIHADVPQLFRCFTFDSWYHEGWPWHDPGQTNFSQFFDLMLRTPTTTPAPRFPWATPALP